jgi:hypothetical protein
VTEAAAPDVDVAIVQPAPEPAPEPEADTAIAVAEAATDEAQQSEIAVLTARVIEQSEQLGRLEGLLSGLESRYAPASNEYVTRPELDGKLAALEQAPVDEDAIVVQPPEPEEVPEETAEEAPAQTGPPRIRVKW